MSRMVIMAGGTGGHVIPALAVAAELTSRNVDVSWIGSREGLESRLVPDAGIEFDPIDIKGLRKSGIVRKLLMPFMLVKAMFQTFGVLRRRKPDAVLGMGGFVSGPGGLVSAILRIPLILHEQNSVAGMTNRWLAKISRHVMSGFPVASGIENPNWIGNPVRSGILQVSEPETRIRQHNGALRILVVGGSQGAGVFNENLPRLLSKFTPGQLEVWHQCGKQGLGNIAERYQAFGIKSRVEVFIDDMASAYEWCDVVVCRSGAMTVSEICGAGIAAIFVPYPYAVNDHQAGNAAYLVSEGAAYMVRQPDFLGGQWLEVLEKFHSSRETLIEMGRAARNLAKPAASVTLAEICLEAMHA